MAGAGLFDWQQGDIENKSARIKKSVGLADPFIFVDLSWRVEVIQEDWDSLSLSSSWHRGIGDILRQIRVTEVFDHRILA